MVQFFSFENLTVSSTGVGFTSATVALANYARVYVDDADVRMRLDGTVPTATVGELIPRDSVVLLQSQDEVNRARFIRTSGSDATLMAQFGLEKGHE